MIGVLITLSDKPLFVKKTKRTLIDNKCAHYNESMCDFKFCSECGRSLAPVTKEHISFESKITGFSDCNTYVFKDEKYAVQREHEMHYLSKRYFIPVQTIFKGEHDTKFNANFYIGRLQLANEIATDLEKQGLKAFPGIISFVNHDYEFGRSG
jgi:hypothetical protein